MADITKKSFKLDLIEKPIVYKDNGNAIVTVCATSETIDTDGELLDIDSFKGVETMVVSAYHNQCGGTPVNTGAKIIGHYNEVIDGVKMMFMEIEVKPTDQVIYCDYGSLERKSNGNLLEEIEKGVLAFVSMGFKIGQRIKADGYLLLKNCIGIEISFLDVRPANLHANVFKQYTMETIKTKCFCGNAKEGRIITDVKTASQVLTLKGEALEDGSWLAVDSEGNELNVTAEDYELIRTPDEAREHFMAEQKAELEKEAEEKGSEENEEGSEEVQEEKPTETIDSLKEEVETLRTQLTAMTEKADKACACQAKKKPLKEKSSEENEEGSEEVQEEKPTETTDEVKTLQEEVAKLTKLVNDNFEASKSFELRLTKAVNYVNNKFDNSQAKPKPKISIPSILE